MFYECTSLVLISDSFSFLNLENTEELDYVFYKCVLLKSIPDISNWNTSNIKNMNYMFYECYSLENLPDTSKWDIRNVVNMSYMFYGCEDKMKKH